MEGLGRQGERQWIVIGGQRLEKANDAVVSDGDGLGGMEMNKWRGIWARVMGTMRRRGDSEIAAELESHVALHIEENLRRGMTPQEARRQALIALGGVEQVKESYREQRGVVWLESLSQDVRFALRMLRKNPGFTAIAIVTLALGIGANTAIFSLTDQVLLQILPVQHPEQLVVLSSTEEKWGNTRADYDLANSFSYPMYKNLRDRNVVFSGLLTCFHVDISVVGRGRAEMADGELVSGDFFNVLGVHPALGRVFSEADETAPGANPVAVLNYAYWKSRFGSDASVLNQTLDINGYPLTVVGVSQPGFNSIQAGAKPGLYVPITMKPQMTPGWNGLDSSSTYFLPIMGRLDSGVSMAQAQASLEPLFHDLLAAEYPGIVARWGATADEKRFVDDGTIKLSPGAQGRPVLQHSVETPLLFLSAMVGLVLLIACSNLACLLLARGEARHHDVAVRLALGAGRRRIVRQLLTESMILAVAGGAAGLFLARVTLGAFVAALPPDPSASALSASLDFRVLAFTASAAILSGVLCGLFPAIRASFTDLQSAFKAHGGTATSGFGAVRVRKSLIVAQVAMTAVLLVVASLFGESLIRTEQVSLGMNISHIIQFDFTPGLNRYSPAQAADVLSRLRERLAAVPGVNSVSAAADQILAGGTESDTVNYEGYIPPKGEDSNPWVNYVEPDFFSTLGIPLIRGREFEGGDSSASPEVAIISESIAKKYFASRNPIGFRLGFGGERPHITIVGVVADVRQNDPRMGPSPTLYIPCAQEHAITGATFYVRTPLPPDAMVATLRNAAGQEAPDVPVANFRTLTQQLNDTVFDERFVTFFTLALGLAAALLASIGLYGVMAYLVTRRTREIGIRAALGALPKGLAGMVLWEAGRLTLIGVVIGLSVAVPISRLIRSQLFEVQAGNPLVFLLSALLLISVALVACYIPARRAMRVDPMQALRHEWMAVLGGKAKSSG